MRVDDALRVAGGAGGVAQAGGRVLVEGRPAEILVRLGEPFLVGRRIAQARRRHVGGVGQDDEPLDGGKARRQLLDERHEGQVEEQQPVLGVVHDVDDLVLEEPRIDRVVDRADAGDAVPGLEMPPGVPGQRRDAVAEADAVHLQALGEAQGARADLGIIGPVNRTFDRSRHDGTPGVLRGRVIDDAVDEKGPILHEALHGVLRFDVRGDFRWAAAPERGGRAGAGDPGVSR